MTIKQTMKKLIGMKRPVPSLTDKLPSKNCPQCGNDCLHLLRGTVHECCHCKLRVNVHDGMIIDIPCQ